MKKRQALKILKICRNVLFKEKSALGQRWERAFRYHNKQVYKNIKRKVKIIFSKPHWKNISICKDSDYQTGGVRRDLAALNEQWEDKMRKTSSSRAMLWD